MMEIKLTPLVMFLLILIVLSLSMVIGNYFIAKDVRDHRQMESFISFNYSDGHNGSSVKIAPYSSLKTVIEVYDSIYFDETNGNVLEVYGNVVPSGGSLGNVDLTSSSISQINVLNRFNNQVIYDSSKLVGKNGAMQSDIIAEGRVLDTKEAYDAWSYTTQNTKNDKYSLIYIPWTDDTYLHVIDSAGNNILSMFNAYETSNTSVLYSSVTTKPAGPMKQTSITSSAKDGTFVRNASYNTLNKSSGNIYQVTSQVFYDPAGYIYIQQDPNNPGVIYDRSGNSSSPQKLHSINEFTSWVTPQSASQASGSNGPFVLVMCIGYKTILAVLTSNSSGFSTGKVAKFMGSSQTIDSATNGSNSHRSNSLYDSDSDDDENANTWKGSNKYSYNDVFNKCGADFSKWGSQCWQKFYQLSYTSSGSLVNTNIFSDDYILKTQVVPPVCPSCPSCPKVTGNVCTNCGGNGGQGTGQGTGGTGQGTGQGKNMAVTGSVTDKGADINAVTGDSVTTVGSGTFASNADANSIGGGLTLASIDTVAGIEDVAKTGANVVTTGIGSVGGLANNVVNSATGIVKDTGSGAYNLVSGGASGANSLLRDTASGVVNLGKSSDRDRDGYYDDGYNNQGASGSGSYGRGSGSYGGIGGNGSYGGSTADSNFGRMQSGKNTPIDNYSYYGALQSKGNANFMPITADFSNFRK